MKTGAATQMGGDAMMRRGNRSPLGQRALLVFGGCRNSSRRWRWAEPGGGGLPAGPASKAEEAEANPTSLCVSRWVK